jgi:homoserine kinase
MLYKEAVFPEVNPGPVSNEGNESIENLIKKISPTTANKIPEKNNGTIKVPAEILRKNDPTKKQLESTTKAFNELTEKHNKALKDIEGLKGKAKLYAGLGLGGSALAGLGGYALANNKKQDAQ